MIDAKKILTKLFSLLRRVLSLLSRQAPEAPKPVAPKGAPKPLNSFSLNYPLLAFSEKDIWRLSDGVTGLHIFGGNGGGKTSGPGRAIIKALMAAGYGGLVLTAKPDECALIKKYAAEVGCLDRVIVFSPSNPYRLNFLRYEQLRPGSGAGLTSNITRLLTTIQEATERGDDAASKEQGYFKRAQGQLINNAVEVAVLSGEQLSVELLHKIIMSAPTSPEQVESVAWQLSSLLYRLLERALNDDKLTPRQKSDLQLAGTYFLNEFPQLPHETRGSIVSTFTTTVDMFLRGVIGELFSTGLNIVPEITLEGAILVIDLSVKTYGPVGLAAQILWKYIWQQAIERRDVSANPRPQFLWIDEAHLFLNAHDVSFATTARSSLCCMCLLSQTRSNYFHALGGEEKGKALTTALMAVLQTKIFCSNSDPDTNEWASSVFAKSFQSKFQSGINRNEKGGGGSNAGASESLEFNVQPAEFLTLKKGGLQNGLLVEAFVFGGGCVFNASGQTFIKTAFRQV